MISAGNESRPVGGRDIFLGRPSFLPGLGLDLGARRCRFAGGLASMDLESESGGIPGRGRSRGFVDGLATVPVPIMIGMCDVDDEEREV